MIIIFIKSSNVIFITLGTPIDEYFNPNFANFFNNFEKIIPYLKNGQIIILEAQYTQEQQEKF